MIRNLLGSIINTSSDYANFIINELDSQPYYEIRIKENTTHGFETHVTISSRTGIYCLYKDKQPLYIGQTEHSIHQRLARFVAGVRGTERIDENHSAAYKYVEHFGRDLSDVTFKYSEVNVKELPEHVTLGDIERETINLINPYFNKETYDNFSFQNVVLVEQIK